MVRIPMLTMGVFFVFLPAITAGFGIQRHAVEPHPPHPDKRLNDSVSVQQELVNGQTTDEASGWYEEENDEQAYEMVVMVNLFRCQHAVDPLKWDNDLAAAAQKTVDRKVFLRSEGDSLLVDGKRTGETMAWGFVSGIEAVRSWHCETDCTEDGTAEYEDIYKKPISDYTQLVWRDTTRIGCAHGVARDWDGLIGKLWVCRFSSPGNVQGKFSENVAKLTDDCHMPVFVDTCPKNYCKPIIPKTSPMSNLHFAISLRVDDPQSFVLDVSIQRAFQNYFESLIGTGQKDVRVAFSTYITSMKKSLKMNLEALKKRVQVRADIVYTVPKEKAQEIHFLVLELGHGSTRITKNSKVDDFSEGADKFEFVQVINTYAKFERQATGMPTEGAPKVEACVICHSPVVATEE